MSSNNYAGFWLRFVAYIIDYIIIYVLQSFLIIPVLAMMGISFFATEGFDLSGMEEDAIIAMIFALMSAMATWARLFRPQIPRDPHLEALG